jgi:hypothetical protein
VGHAVAVVAISGVVYLILAGKVLDAVAIAVVLVVIVFLKSAAPGDNRVCCCLPALQTYSGLQFGLQFIAVQRHPGRTGRGRWSRLNR